MNDTDDAAVGDDTPSAAQHPRRLRSSRLEHITRRVNEDGVATVEQLAAELGVSRMTVHRDLDELQGAGALRKVRGGASAHRSTRYESDLQFRATTAVDEKKRMAASALDLVNDGDVVIIDDSSSALAMVADLPSRGSLTVITNFLPAIQQLTARPELNVIALGGLFVPRYSSFLGVVCENSLADLHADVLFASTSSLRDNVLYHQDQQVVTTKMAMVRAAQRRVLLMDHTKIGRGALHRMCAVQEFTDVIVDDRVDAAAVERIGEAGVTVHVV